MSAGPSPRRSPPPAPVNVHAYHVYREATPPGVGHGERPFSAELDCGGQRWRDRGVAHVWLEVDPWGQRWFGCWDGFMGLSYSATATNVLWVE
jgi:hypothetical protein